MKDGRVVAALSLAAIAGLIVWLFVSTPRTSTPELASSGSASPGPFDSPVATATTPAPADPCHVNGASYCTLNPEVTQATIRSTICVSGWTATIRPPESYTEALKLQQMAAESLPGPASDYEEDHRMPLELGGDPRDPLNLSPESHATSYAKDSAEGAAKRQVCAGADLRTVQAAFVATWLGPYPAYR